MEQSQLSKEEIERMTMEAKEYMAADEEKERIKAKNLLEEFLYNKVVFKVVFGFGDRVGWVRSSLFFLNGMIGYRDGTSTVFCLV